MQITSQRLVSQLTVDSTRVYPEGEEKKMTLRLPPDLHAALVKIARDDRRSLHAEIITLLEDAARQRGELEKKP
jgi:hypothetical protein